MGLLEDLNRNKKLKASCPHCSEAFSLADAQLFDPRRPLGGAALEKLQALQQGLRDERAALKDEMTRAPKKSRTSAESANIGKVVEKVAPSLPGFELDSGDCRALFEPIDYVVFDGLSSKGRIDSLRFVDVKSQSAGLTPRQRDIRKVIEAGKVELVIDDNEGTP